ARLRTRVTGGYVGLQIGRLRLVEARQARLRKPLREEGKVAPIGIDRVAREPVFEPEGIAEGLDQQGIDLNGWLAHHPGPAREAGGRAADRPAPRRRRRAARRRETGCRRWARPPPCR